MASGAAGVASGLVNVVLDNPANAPHRLLRRREHRYWDSWRTVPANITRTTGTHTVYLEFSSVAGQPYVACTGSPSRRAVPAYRRRVRPYADPSPAKRRRTPVAEAVISPSPPEVLLVLTMAAQLREVPPLGEAELDHPTVAVRVGADRPPGTGETFADGRTVPSTGM